MQSAQGSGADFRLAGPTFRDDEGDTFPIQLPLDRLSHSQLGVVERIARLLLNVVVDGQHLLRQRLGGRVEQGHELVPYAIRHGDAEGVQITGDAFHALKAVWLVRVSAGNGNLPAFQALLQNLHHIRVLGPQRQHPGVQALRQGEHLQLTQAAPVNKSVQHIVPKLRDQGRSGLAVQFLKEAVPVPCRGEDVAFAGLDGLLFAGFLSFVLICGVGKLGIIVGHEGSHGILAVVGHLPLVLLGDAVHLSVRVVLNSLHRTAAIDGVRHGLDHLRVAAEADGGDDAALVVPVQDDGVGVGVQPYLRLGVKIFQFDQSALCHSLKNSFPF